MQGTVVGKLVSILERKRTSPTTMPSLPPPKSRQVARLTAFFDFFQKKILTRGMASAYRIVSKRFVKQRFKTFFKKNPNTKFYNHTNYFSYFIKYK
jgi:hypothetical protein